MIVHQSQLQQLARCAAAMGYARAGAPSKTNSRAAYGSVLHHALQVFERDLHMRRIADPKASIGPSLNNAMATFTHYWNPVNISEICDPVPADGWLAGDKYGSLNQRGIDALRQYALAVEGDASELMATEFSFMVPIDGTWDEEMGEPHYLAGSIDRLVARHIKRQLVLGIDDYKTGKDYKYLRQNVQGSAYAYASTKLEFWTGHRGEDGFGEERGRELFEQFQGKGRKFTWINMRTFKFMDGGWRGPNDYHRFAVAITQMVALIRADIFPLTIFGEVCQYCDFRDICAGTGTSAVDHGNPFLDNQTFPQLAR